MSFSVSFIKYIGLLFTSVYIFEIYNPNIPKKNNCSPLKNVIIQARLGHPDTGSPNINVFAIITIININEIKQNNKPIFADIVNGFDDVEVMASNEYLISFFIGNLVVPVTLSGVGIEIHLILYPTYE